MQNLSRSCLQALVGVGEGERGKIVCQTYQIETPSFVFSGGAEGMKHCEIVDNHFSFLHQERLLAHLLITSG